MPLWSWPATDPAPSAFSPRPLRPPARWPGSRYLLALAAAAVVPALFAVAVEAQTPAPTPAQAPTGGEGGLSGFPVHFSVLGGVDGVSPEPHLFGGVGAAWVHGPGTGAEGLGAQGIFLVGTGADYGSLLGGVGPSLRIRGAAGSRDLRLWAGPGWYRESSPMDGSRDGVDPLAGEGASDARRAAPVGMGGVQGRFPLGAVALDVGVVTWVGRVKEEGFRTPVLFRGVRLVVGVSR